MIQDWEVEKRMHPENFESPSCNTFAEGIELDNENQKERSRKICEGDKKH